MESKIDNVLSAELLIKRQVRDLNAILSRTGTDLVLDKKYVQEDFNKQCERAEDMLAFAIEHYDGIVNELKSNTVIREVVKEVSKVEEKVSKPEEKPKTVEKKKETVEKKKDDENGLRIASSDDAAANLTEEDMNAMGAFFGF